MFQERLLECIEESIKRATTKTVQVQMIDTLSVAFDEVDSIGNAKVVDCNTEARKCWCVRWFC